MPVVDRGHAQEHKDDGFGRRGQHFQRVLDGGVRFVRYVLLDVVLHRDAAEGDAARLEIEIFEYQKAFLRNRDFQEM